MTTDALALAPARSRWILRPAIELLALVAGAAAVGLMLVRVPLDAVDGAARSVVALHGTWLDGLMTTITSLGDEVLLIAVSGVLVWHGYRNRPEWGRFFALVATGGLA